MAKDGVTIILVLTGVIALLVVAGVIDLSSFSSSSQVVPPPHDNTGNEDICVYDGATMTIGPMQEKWNPATSVASVGARLFVNGVDRGVKADGATVDVNYGDVIELYYGENETEGTASYFTAMSTFTVPCTSAFSTADKDDNEKLVATESTANNLSIKIFNEDNGNLNSGSDVETLAAGDVVQLETRFQPTYEDGYSPACPSVVVLEGHSTYFDELRYAGWATANVPKQHTASSTSNGIWAYEMPIIPLPVTGAYSTISASLIVDASTSDPTAAHNLTMTIYDCDYFRNGNTGNMELGVETDTNSDIGRDNIVTTIYID